MQPVSTKPYLIRAIYEWCVDQGFAPYLAVVVDRRTRVPRAYVQNGQIVLNVGPEATQGLSMGNDLITFQARFGGVAQQIEVPVDNVSAIYARENGHGMAFEVELPDEVEASAGMVDEENDSGRTPASATGKSVGKPPAGRSHLKVIK